MIEGFLLINKPADISSYGCIARIKRIIGKKNKIGHAGTLDPFATGLLVIGIGRAATRNLDMFMKCDKEYIAQGKLGELTDTLDNTGSIIKTCLFNHVTQETMLDAVTALGTSYEQVPPIYSAKKIDGKRLYMLARTGKKSPEELAQLAQKKRKIVQLHEMELLDFTPPFFTIRARVSHGTYIRSLVDDIAQKSDSCATTYSLKRTQIGPIACDLAVDIDKLNSENDIENTLINVDIFLQQYATK